MQTNNNSNKQTNKQTNKHQQTNKQIQVVVLIPLFLAAAACAAYAAYADSGQCLRFHRSVSTVLRSNLFLRGRSLWKTFLQQVTNKQTNVNKQCIKAKIKQTREDVNK